MDEIAKTKSKFGKVHIITAFIVIMLHAFFAWVFVNSKVHQPPKPAVLTIENHTVEKVRPMQVQFIDVSASRSNRSDSSASSIGSDMASADAAIDVNNKLSSNTGASREADIDDSVRSVDVVKPKEQQQEVPSDHLIPKKSVDNDATQTTEQSNNPLDKSNNQVLNNDFIDNTDVDDEQVTTSTDSTNQVNSDNSKTVANTDLIPQSSKVPTLVDKSHQTIAPKPSKTVDVDSQSKGQIKGELQANGPDTGGQAGNTGSDTAASSANIKQVEGQAGGGRTNQLPKEFALGDAKWVTEPKFKLPNRFRRNSGPIVIYVLRLKLTVDKQGNVTNARTLDSSGNTSIDKEMERIAKTGKLIPFTDSQGAPTTGTVVVPIKLEA